MHTHSPYEKLIENIIQNRKDEKVRETKTVRSGGIGFFGLLALVFITLKLAQIGPVATWSWWWVLSPLWIPSAIVLIILFVILVIILLASLQH